MRDLACGPHLWGLHKCQSSISQSKNTYMKRKFLAPHSDTKCPCSRNSVTNDLVTHVLRDNHLPCQLPSSLCTQYCTAKAPWACQAADFQRLITTEIKSSFHWHSIRYSTSMELMSDSLHAFYLFGARFAKKKKSVRTLGSYFLILPIKLSQHKRKTYTSNSFVCLLESPNSRHLKIER